MVGVVRLLPVLCRVRDGSVVLLLGVVVLFVGGCSSSDGATSTSAVSAGSEVMTVSSTTVLATTTTSAATTSTTEDLTEAVVAALEGYNHAYVLATDPMDPTHPELEIYLAGGLLTRVQKLLQQYLDAGQSGRGEIRSEVLAVEVLGDAALVEQCFLDGTAVLNEDGSVAVEAGVEPVLLSSSLRLTPEGWRVDREFYTNGVEEQCDFSS